MLKKEAYILVEVLGKDDLQVRALVAAAANPGMEGAVHEMLRSLVRQRGWDPDNPPAFALPRGLSPSDYPVGVAMSGDVAGEEVGPAEADLMGHIGVFGQTGTGKTTLVKLLISSFLAARVPGDARRRVAWVLDVAGEYPDLLRLYAREEMVWLAADDLGLNPFAVPTGEDGKPVMSPDKYINSLRQIFRLAWLNDPSCNLLCEVLRDEYQRRGVFDGRDDWPSLSDVLEVLQRLNPQRGSDRARARDKLLDRLESLRAMLPGLDVQKSRDFRRLLDRSVILDLVDVKDSALPVLFALIVMLLREIFRSEGSRGISRMLVMDEAHLYMGGETNKRTSDLQEATPSSVLRDIRKVGVCGCVATHFVSDLARGVMGNLGSVFVLRQGNRESVRQAAGSVNVKPWQEDEIAGLAERRAIARFSRYGDPVYLAVNDARALGLGVSPPPSREEAREWSRPILETIPYVRRSETPTAGPGAGGAGATGAGANAEGAVNPTADGKGYGPAAADGGLQPRERKVLARIAERPWELVLDRAEALGLDREGEGDARATLVVRGLIGFAGKVRAKNVLYELTARGRAVADAMGLTVAKTGGAAGGVVHMAIIEYMQRSLGRHSPGFRFLRAGISPTTAGVQPDLLLVTPGGSRIPIQACHRNQPQYEADALLKLQKLAMLGAGHADKVDFVLCVAVNKRHKAAIERALQERNGGRMPDRVVLLDFDTVVDPAFDWASVFEFPL